MKMISFLFVMLCSICFGQYGKTIEGVVTSVDGKSLPYVNIMILNKEIGTSSNKQGIFHLSDKNILEKDTIVFSYLGYETLKIQVGEIKSVHIRLKQRPIELSEVVIGSSVKKKKGKSLILNKFNKRKAFVVYSPTPFANDSTLWVPYRHKEPTIETMFFPNDSGYGSSPKLTGVLLKMKTFKKNAKFRLRIFDVTKYNSPSKDLLLSPLLITVTEKNQVIKVDLEKYNIVMPKKGLFIGIEYLLIPENLSVVKNSNDIEARLYSPFLFYNSSKKADFFYYIFSKGKWLKFNKTVPSPLKKDKNYSCIPAISCILEIYN